MTSRRSTGTLTPLSTFIRSPARPSKLHAHAVEDAATESVGECTHPNIADCPNSCIFGLAHSHDVEDGRRPRRRERHRCRHRRLAALRPRRRRPHRHLTRARVTPLAGALTLDGLRRPHRHLSTVTLVLVGNPPHRLLAPLRLAVLTRPRIFTGKYTQCACLIRDGKPYAPCLVEAADAHRQVHSVDQPPPR